MYRLAIAFGLALACFGCASDVEDDQTEDTSTTEPPANPPKRLLIAPYAVNPIQFAVPVLDEYRLNYQPPARQTPYDVWPQPPE